jgi:chemotaxis signal transduction protein
MGKSVETSVDAPEAGMLNFNKCSHFLRIKLKDQFILITLNQTHMVLPLMKLQSVPHSDPALEGIINYHGQPLPVYHLATLIHESKPHYDLDTPLLLASLSNGLAGFLVSEVTDILNLSGKEIILEKLNNTMPYVIGLLERDDWSAWVLDLEKLIQFHQTELERSDG